MVPLALATLALTGCAAFQRVLADVFAERPPAPLDEATVTSDARLDSTGALAGSFVGEGTNQQIHLVSSDTGLIASLARRFRPARERRGDIWQWLALRGSVPLTLDPVDDSALVDQPALVGTPDGITPARLRRIVLFGSACGWRGTRAEFVVQGGRRGAPPLRGPAVGAFLDPRAAETTRPAWRELLDPPSSEVAGQLVARTRTVMDSLLVRKLPSRDLPLAAPAGGQPSLNTGMDEDAADLVAFRLDDRRIRYAVSLRERRQTARGAELMAAIVMVWDSTGSWRQIVFRPTLLELRRTRVSRAYAGLTPALFWRHLEPVRGFLPDRDYLWMEQVNVEDGSVLWVILDPGGNVVVAAAEMEGPC